MCVEAIPKKLQPFGNCWKKVLKMPVLTHFSLMFRHLFYIPHVYQLACAVLLALRRGQYCQLMYAYSEFYTHIWGKKKKKKRALISLCATNEHV